MVEVGGCKHHGATFLRFAPALCCAWVTFLPSEKRQIPKGDVKVGGRWTQQRWPSVTPYFPDKCSRSGSAWAALAFVETLRTALQWGIDLKT